MKIKVKKDPENWYDIANDDYPGGRESSNWEKLAGKIITVKDVDRDGGYFVDVPGGDSNWVVGKLQCEPMFKVFYDRYSATKI